ncbi:MAG: protein-L-isoaspartate(D-aspartate) O-methyltransferase [Pseudomonadota bacterium]
MTAENNPGTAAEARYREQRARLLEEIRAEMRLTRSYTGRERLSPAVEKVLMRVPRHEFVPVSERVAAYANMPLSIGSGQTISQPYIVALMTELLDLSPEDRVLEVGTGSGYQAAVLAGLARQVYSLEMRAELAATARERLQRLGYDNVEVRVADGYQGWSAQAPYDAIMVTAAAPYIPEALKEQLKTGGRMVIPVGDVWGPQRLQLVVREEQGYDIRNVLDVAFVPLVRGAE